MSIDQGLCQTEVLCDWERCPEGILVGRFDSPGRLAKALEAFNWSCTTDKQFCPEHSAVLAGVVSTEPSVFDEATVAESILDDLRTGHPHLIVAPADTEIVFTGAAIDDRQPDRILLAVVNRFPNPEEGLIAAIFKPSSLPIDARLADWIAGWISRNVDTRTEPASRHDVIVGWIAYPAFVYGNWRTRRRITWRSR